MRWIHLSDIHYNPGTQMNRSTNQLRKKLPQYIRDNGIVADEMFITGDFRNATAPCDDEESLVDDTVNFIMEIANSAKIADNSHIHIVPGNHDLTRVDTSPSITKIRNCYDVSEGGFKIDILRQLISRFGFFVKIKNQLNPGDPLWSPELLPLHVYKCYSGYTVLYLNTSLTCGDNKDRGRSHNGAANWDKKYPIIFDRVLMLYWCFRYISTLVIFTSFAVRYWSWTQSWKGTGG